MKYAEIARLQKEGLITAEQQARIVERYRLKEDDSKFLLIISIIGGVLVAAGIVLLIAANWNEIPRGVKIGGGLALMIGAHWAGWRLRQEDCRYKAAEGLHLAGSLLFLGNIALIGQVYHLSSRPANAFLLWFLGIAALPWILRSPAQHFLTLIAFCCWFVAELNDTAGLFYCQGARQVIVYALLGLVFVGYANLLRFSSRRSTATEPLGSGDAFEFAHIPEVLGLLGFQFFFYLLTWGVLNHVRYSDQSASWLVPALGGLSVVLLIAPARQALTSGNQWALTWIATLLGGVVLMLIALYLPTPYRTEVLNDYSWQRWLWTVGLFVFCMVEIRAGIELRAEHMVNLGIAFIALTITSTYVNLFGTMAQTGLMFVVSGVFLIGFGIFLEKKRRELLKRLNAIGSGPSVQPA